MVTPWSPLVSYVGNRSQYRPQKTWPAANFAEHPGQMIALSALGRRSAPDQVRGGEIRGRRARRGSRSPGTRSADVSKMLVDDATGFTGAGARIGQSMAACWAETLVKRTGCWPWPFPAGSET